MQKEIRVNRNFSFLFLLVLLSLLQFAVVSANVSTVDHFIGSHTDFLVNNALAAIPILLVVSMVVIVILPIFHICYMFAREADEEANLKELYSNEIPNINEMMEMNCTLCNGKIDRPTNLIQHLGIDQTKNYLEFCKESGTTPSLYCCGCYSMVEKNQNWQKAMDQMIDDAIRFHELRKHYEGVKI